MSWTLHLSGNAIKKAGVNVNSTIVNYGTNQVFLDQLSDEAESQACDLARSNLIANYTSLTTNGKAILAQFCDAVVAQNLISHDLDAIGRATASVMFNILENQKAEAKRIIMDDKYRTYLGIT